MQQWAPSAVQLGFCRTAVGCCIWLMQGARQSCTAGCVPIEVLSCCDLLQVVPWLAAVPSGWLFHHCNLVAEAASLPMLSDIA